MLLSVFLFISCQTCPETIVTCARCDKVASRGHLNILNINVLFLTEDMDERFGHIADFAAENEVDLILLQEIVGGSFAGTDNSAEDLREILRTKHNLDYNISTAWEIGEPNIFSSANAILSRCEIKFVQVERLPYVSELSRKVKIRDKTRKISFRRNVQLVRLDIPDLGKINIYNTHLCARCDIDGRADHTEALLEFIDGMEANMPGDHPSLLGGDFNFDRFDNQGAEKFLWEKVINKGFIDAYADFVIANSGGQETLETLCEDEDNADEHCTVGVSKLNGHNARRIDYIFAKSPANIRAARVVFNELVNNDEPTVSDHAGVFISLELP
jgi:maltose 6'-phosphate phosphatase